MVGILKCLQNFRSLNNCKVGLNCVTRFHADKQTNKRVGKLNKNVGKIGEDYRKKGRMYMNFFKNIQRRYVVSENYSNLTNE